jgi:hypothetical protein
VYVKFLSVCVLFLIFSLTAYTEEEFINILLITLVPMLLIWFPCVVEDFTYGAGGSWLGLGDGPRISKRTPKILLVVFGWVLLLVLFPAFFLNLLKINALARDL